MFDDLSLFTHIVKNQSLSAAAEYLKLPPATVTRRLKKLEATLGYQLIHRSARKFSLTSEGEAYYQSCAPLLEQLEAATRNLNQDLQQLQGPLRVLAPTNISIGLLQPMWSAFIKSYPAIQLHLLLNNEREDLLSAQIDLALRIGPQEDSQLYQKRLGSVSTVLVAAPDYLQQQGTPRVLADLEQHHLITGNILPVWDLYNPETKIRERFYPQPGTFVNDITLATQMAVDGIGIALLPLSEVSNALQTNQLIRILPPYHGPQRDIFAVWPSGRLLSARAKCLRDFMQSYMAKTAVLQDHV
ncbi:LysR family transcriptional regulator [Kiloniella laminariae]|uniref:LysR family transcriptional regulator n=1 Tax=Kiloniella laminariae TaxID=454162 RepID=A0ABT4LKG6_9PROT|nr:LysR family transcriptional regulator [Kiloniella laminariae]MCZ4281445.1 LysR family transcriptional regulator [Kiloniella laminariae]